MTAILEQDHQLKPIHEVYANHQEMLELLKLYQRAANYLAAAQIYLQDNVLLREPLKIEDIKPRLLGHWGTCPGINLIYAHLNRLILQYDLDMFLVTGPGHGAPANLANLYLEGSLQEFYPNLTQDLAGLKQFIRSFSWPDGFPSHLYPGLPGTIHEGGELGYALATAFGAVMDNPNLIVACIVGDGEAETGPTATAWHSYKFIDPVESGAVLPIVHINGYKISSPTLYGTMGNQELLDLFHGYGYQSCIVEKDDLDAALFAAMEWAYHRIRTIQEAARSGQPIAQPRWPVILLRSPKGMGGIKEINGQRIEGSYRSHQVPAKDVRDNPKELKALEDWLRSYRPQELFDPQGCPVEKILQLCPKGTRRMGSNPHTFGGKICQPLRRMDIHKYEVQLDRQGQEVVRGQKKMGNIKGIVPLLKDIIGNNPHNFRIFSPDELESNKLNVFEVTHRDYQWPLQAWDTFIGPQNGRVLEILSEHTCQGWMQGYALTGRYGLFPSYEAFLGIVATMVDQYAKFIKMSNEFPWRLPVPSLNYLATSTLWRQEHNGFSHQNPSFLNTLLNKKGQTVRIYLPPDANCLISTMDHCLRGKNYVNLVICDKLEMPQWLTMDEAVNHCRAGASIWKWASTEDGIDPDVVLVGIGDDMTAEVLAAAQLLMEEVPALRVRVVNVTDLLVVESESLHPHGLSEVMFNALFTKHRPVIFNFHGYPSALKQLLFHRGDTQRFYINGYQEEGTTTTPFDMLVRNGASRYHVANQALRLASEINPDVAASAMEKVSLFEYILRDHRRYIVEHGDDPASIKNWVWKRPQP
jgi:xylulose-5-phosphate/fructose-6-phosphate phosphoketolase